MADTAITLTDDQQAQADFSAGFEDQPPTTTAHTPEPADNTTSTTKVEPAAETIAAAELAPVSAAPEYAQVTKEQWDALQAAANKTAGFEAQLTKAFGTLGQLQQTVNKLKGTPAAADTTVQEPTKPIADAAAPDWKDALKQASVQYQKEALAEDHPTWETIVGTEGDANNEYRKWLSTQPVEYQHKINATNSAGVVSKSIDKFIAAKAAPRPASTPAPKIAARKTVIESAVQPRGDGGQPASSKNADDDFRSGFNDG